jgi:hypothetical protein
VLGDGDGGFVGFAADVEDLADGVGDDAPPGAGGVVGDDPGQYCWECFAVEVGGVLAHGERGVERNGDVDQWP